MNQSILIACGIVMCVGMTAGAYNNNNCNFQYNMCMRRGRQSRRVCNQQLNECNLFGTTTLPSTTSFYTTTYPATSSTTSYYTSPTTSYYTTPAISSTTTYYTTPAPFQCRGRRCRNNQYRQQQTAAASAPACTGMLCNILGDKGGLSGLISQHTAGGNKISQRTTGGRDGVSGQLGQMGSGTGGLLSSLGYNIGK